MVKRKWGRIVNITSIGGQWGGMRQVHYAAAKAGLINLTHSLARLYSPLGITANAVAPGLVATDMIRKELKSKAGKQKAAQIPVGRIAEPEEIAAGVVYLVSDGGRLCHRPDSEHQWRDVDVMKTLLILGAGKEQVAAIAAAKAKGIRTLVLDMNPKADGAGLADEFHAVSTRDRDAILKFLAGYPGKIDGVMTIASDIPHMVSAAAEALGVRHIPQSGGRALRPQAAYEGKAAGSGRECARLCPHHAAWRICEAFIAKVGFPVVIKPVDNSGARGVQRLTSGMDIGAAFAYARGFSYGGEVIAEKFISGLQISTEGLFHDGALLLHRLCRPQLYPAG